ncbi:PREDICTED: dihydropyrimidinase-like isoform X2 [Branchiostoma belcheri]|uniref:dihydropyrimidinase n=1 Tax=Branchiostoma belcheri TaxID=7741 RepID=A0A6P4YWA6_BRABE|nr:PREDICTED: dihydropyrimidinase-like isoform X2 [Branchiostoma belcheri]
MPVANRLLVKGGRVVNDDCTVEADVYIEDGVIAQVGTKLATPGGARVLDATGKLVLPGGVDTNVHFQEPGAGCITADDFYTGTKSALAGGTTLVAGFVMQDKDESLEDAFERWKAQGNEKSCCGFTLHACVTSWDDTTSGELKNLVNKGVTSFKTSMAAETRLTDAQLLQLFGRCKELGALPVVHAENGDIIREMERRLAEQGVTGPEGCVLSRPEEAETEAVFRAISLAHAVNVPLYIQPITGRPAADVIATARKSGKLVYGEVTSASVALDGTHCWDPDWRHAAGYVTEPPLRADANTPAHLTNLLANGDLQVCGSSDATLNAEQKALGKDDFRKIPRGVNGVEDRMAVLWETAVHAGKMDENQFVAATSSNAAKVLNMYPKKGRIDVGSDGDLVVWDPAATRTISAKTHHQAVDFNIFEGMVCHGVALSVVLGGKVVIEEGRLLAAAGAGKFVPREPFGSYTHGRIATRDRLQKPDKVTRDPYTGPVSEPVQMTDGFGRQESARASRDLHQSSFSLSEMAPELPEVEEVKSPRSRPSTRVINPPGGRSTSLW